MPMPYSHLLTPPHGRFHAPPPGFPPTNQHMAYNLNPPQQNQSQPQQVSNQFNTAPPPLLQSQHAPQSSTVPQNQYASQLPDTSNTFSVLPSQRQQQLIPTEVTKTCTPTTSSTSPTRDLLHPTVSIDTFTKMGEHRMSQSASQETSVTRDSHSTVVKETSAEGRSTQSQQQETNTTELHSSNLYSNINKPKDPPTSSE